MKTITITRKRKFASALMPYWIILSPAGKDEFMRRHHLEGDLCQHSETGMPIPRLDTAVLDGIGIRIANGETVDIEVDDSVKSIFASTMDGSLSNEIPVSSLSGGTLAVTTKGGFRTVSRPWLEEI